MLTARISQILRSKLEESGFDDELKDLAKGESRWCWDVGVARGLNWVDGEVKEVEVVLSRWVLGLVEEPRSDPRYR